MFRPRQLDGRGGQNSRGFRGGRGPRGGRGLRGGYRFPDNKDMSGLRPSKENPMNRENFYCELCRTQFSTKPLYESHCNSAFHKDKLGIYEKAAKSDLWMCNTCDRAFPDKVLLDKHCLLSRHQQQYRIEGLPKPSSVKKFEENIQINDEKEKTTDGKEKSLEDRLENKTEDRKQLRTEEKVSPADNTRGRRSSFGPMKPPHYCDVCGVDCLNKSNYRIHLESWRHRAAVDKEKEEEKERRTKEIEEKKADKEKREKKGMEKAEEESKKGKFETDKQKVPINLQERNSFFCDICNIPCPSETGYLDHIRGRKHFRVLQQMKPPYRCYNCETKYYNPREFDDHLESKSHMDKAFKSKTVQSNKKENEKEKSRGKDYKHGTSRSPTKYKESKQESDKRRNKAKRGRSRSRSKSRSKSRSRSRSRSRLRQRSRSRSKEKGTSKSKRKEKSSSPPPSGKNKSRDRKKSKSPSKGKGKPVERNRSRSVSKGKEKPAERKRSRSRSKEKDNLVEKGRSRSRSKGREGSIDDSVGKDEKTHPNSKEIEKPVPKSKLKVKEKAKSRSRSKSQSRSRSPSTEKELKKKESESKKSKDFKENRKVEIKTESNDNENVHDLREKLNKNKQMIITKTLRSDDDISEKESKDEKQETGNQSSGQDADSMEDIKKRAEKIREERLMKQTKEKINVPPEAESVVKEQLIKERNLELIRYKEAEEEYKRLCLEEDYLKRRIDLFDDRDPRRDNDLGDLIRVERAIRNIREELELRDMMIVEKERYLAALEKKTYKEEPEIEEPPPVQKPFVVDYSHGTRKTSSQLPEGGVWLKEPKESKTKTEGIKNAKADVDQRSEPDLQEKLPEPSVSVDDSVIDSKETDVDQAATTEKEVDLREQLDRERLLRKLGPELDQVSPALRQQIIDALTAKEGKIAKTGVESESNIGLTVQKDIGDNLSVSSSGIRDLREQLQAVPTSKKDFQEKDLRDELHPVPALRESPVPRIQQRLVDHREAEFEQLQNERIRRYQESLDNTTGIDSRVLPQPERSRADRDDTSLRSFGSSRERFDDARLIRRSPMPAGDPFLGGVSTRSPITVDNRYHYSDNIRGEFSDDYNQRPLPGTSDLGRPFRGLELSSMDSRRLERDYIQDDMRKRVIETESHLIGNQYDFPPVRAQVPQKEPRDLSNEMRQRDLELDSSRSDSKKKKRDRSRSVSSNSSSEGGKRRKRKRDHTPDKKRKSSDSKYEKRKGKQSKHSPSPESPRGKRKKKQYSSDRDDRKDNSRKRHQSPSSSPSPDKYKSSSKKKKNEKQDQSPKRQTEKGNKKSKVKSSKKEPPKPVKMTLKGRSRPQIHEGVRLDDSDSEIEMREIENVSMEPGLRGMDASSEKKRWKPPASIDYESKENDTSAPLPTPPMETHLIPTISDAIPQQTETEGRQMKKPREQFALWNKPKVVEAVQPKEDMWETAFELGSGQGEVESEIFTTGQDDTKLCENPFKRLKEHLFGRYNVPQSGTDAERGPSSYPDNKPKQPKSILKQPRRNLQDDSSLEDNQNRPVHDIRQKEAGPFRGEESNESSRARMSVSERTEITKQGSLGDSYQRDSKGEQQQYMSSSGALDDPMNPKGYIGEYEKRIGVPRSAGLLSREGDYHSLYRQRGYPLEAVSREEPGRGIETQVKSDKFLPVPGRIHVDSPGAAEYASTYGSKHIEHQMAKSPDTEKDLRMMHHQSRSHSPSERGPLSDTPSLKRSLSPPAPKKRKAGEPLIPGERRQVGIPLRPQRNVLRDLQPPDDRDRWKRSVDEKDLIKSDEFEVHSLRQHSPSPDRLEGRYRQGTERQPRDGEAYKSKGRAYYDVEERRTQESSAYRKVYESDALYREEQLRVQEQRYRGEPYDDERYRKERLAMEDRYRDSRMESQYRRDAYPPEYDKESRGWLSRDEPDQRYAKSSPRSYPEVSKESYETGNYPASRELPNRERDPDERLELSRKEVYLERDIEEEPWRREDMLTEIDRREPTRNPRDPVDPDWRDRHRERYLPAQSRHVAYSQAETVDQSEYSRSREFTNAQIENRDIAEPPGWPTERRIMDKSVEHGADYTVRERPGWEAVLPPLEDVPDTEEPAESDKMVASVLKTQQDTDRSSTVGTAQSELSGFDYIIETPLDHGRYEPFYCTLCGVYLKSALDKDFHAFTQRHLDAVAESEDEQRKDIVPKSAPPVSGIPVSGVRLSVPPVSGTPGRTLSRLPVSPYGVNRGGNLLRPPYPGQAFPPRHQHRF